MTRTKISFSDIVGEGEKEPSPLPTEKEIKEAVIFTCPAFHNLQVCRTKNRKPIEFYNHMTTVTEQEDIDLLDSHPYVCKSKNKRVYPCEVCKDYRYVYADSDLLEAHMAAVHSRRN